MVQFAIPRVVPQGEARGTIPSMNPADMVWYLRFLLLQNVAMERPPASLQRASYIVSPTMLKFPKVTLIRFFSILRTNIKPF